MDRRGYAFSDIGRRVAWVRNDRSYELVGTCKEEVLPVGFIGNS